MSREQTITLLIAAMGGEGGGVLTDWIVNAARSEGFAVQATSIPGVAQRTGATTYYIEIAREKGATPAFCLSPMAGDVDIFASSEYLETGRAILNGFVTPDKTMLIASTHRVFTLEEKMQSGAAVFENDKLIEAARAASRTSLLFDMTQAGEQLNAVMLGAIAAQLPLSEESFKSAIRAGGLAVERNLKGFAAGQAAVSHLQTQTLLDNDIIQEGIKRLTHYQNKAYADRYLSYLASLREVVKDESFISEVARLLALRLSYEDIARVAQLKISKERFATVEAEVKAGARPHVIIDHFKPGIEELASLMPPRLGAWLIDYATRKGFLDTAFWGMQVKSNTIFGFLRLKFLASLKNLRPYGLRAQQEQRQIESWLALIRSTYVTSPLIAGEIVQLANLIKGYGETYKRGLHHYNAIVTTVLPMITTHPEFAYDALLSARKAAQKDPEGDLLGKTLSDILIKKESL